MEKIFVSGVAGFIGSNLVDHLLACGYEVVGWDNFSTGQLRFVDSASESKRYRFIEGDNLDLERLTRAIGDNPFIFLDTKKIRETGWRNELSIREAVIRTLGWLQENTWVFEKGL